MNNFKEIYNRILNAKDILILTHQRPDPDAIGSMLALKLILDELNINADVVVTEIPDFVEILPGHEFLLTKANKDYDLIILVDTSSKVQLGTHEDFYDQREKLIILDHHKAEVNGDIMRYIDDSAASNTVVVYEFCKANNINLTIMAPVWVYGEGEFGSGFYEYLLAAKSGLPFVMGSKKNKFHTIYVKDLAKAYYLAYKAKLKGINSFLIGSGEAQLMDNIFTMFCNVAGIHKPKIIPKALMYPIGFLLELIYTLAAAKKAPPLTRARVNMFYDNIEYSTKKASKELGFDCKYLEQGIVDTIAWYKERGYL